MFAFCQGLRGLGPAILLPNALAIAGSSYPQGMRKNLVFAAFAMCAPTGGVIGATFGGILAEFSWWPWELWLHGLILCGLGLASILILPQEDRHVAEPNQKFDIVGSGLGVTGLILFNFSWNRASVVGWGDPYVPALLVVGFLSLSSWRKSQGGS